MRKKLASILLTAVLMFSFAISALAAMSSIRDIEVKVNGLNQLSSFNINSFVNKSDMIGDRLQNFNLATAQYQNSVIMTKESLKAILNQIQFIQNAKDITSVERATQLNRLYQDAEAALYDVDSKTLQYLYSVKPLMPTVTYQKFNKRFKAYYQDLNISNSNIISR